MRWILIFNFLVLHPAMPYSQADSFVIESIGVNEGLLSPDIWSLYQDQQLFIWVGSDAGASRFDGTSFQNYTHARDGQRIGTVKAFTEIDGQVLIGSDQGLFIFKEGIFVRCRTGDLNVNALCLSQKKTLWIGCSDGPYSLPEKELGFLISEQEVQPRFLSSFEKLNYADLRITDIREKPNGHILISTYFFIAEYNHQDFKIIWGTPDVKPDILTISISGDDLYHWACDESFFYEYNQGAIKKYTDINGIPSSLVTYKSGHLLLMADRLIYFDHEKKYPILKPGESSEWLRKVMVDREDNIWIGTFEGLIKIKSSVIVEYPSGDEPIYSRAYSIAETKEGEIMFGGNRGTIWTIEQGIFKPLSDFPGKLFRTAEIFSIYPEDPVTWFSSGYQGIAKVQDGQVMHFTRQEGLADNSRYFFFRDGKGDLWTGGDGGLDKITKKDTRIEFENLRYELPNYTYASFLAAAPLSGDSFFLASTHGLFLKKSEEIIPLSFENASFSSLHVTDIITDHPQHLWLATIGEGILYCRFDNEGKVFLVHALSRLNGLPTDAFLCLLKDRQGNIWAGSYQGIGHIRKLDNDSLQVRFYDRFDGFPGKSFNHMDLYQASSGTIWGATTAGIFSLDPASLRPNLIPATPMITHVKIMNTDDDITAFSDSISLNNGLPVGTTLPHHRNFLQISFTGVSQTKPTGLKFRYRMEGLENSWIYPDGERAVSYERLPPGKYTFRLEAGNEDDIWSTSQASFSFEIIPAFWDRTWVQIAGFLSAGFLFFQLFRFYRRKRQLDQFEETVEYFANTNYSSNTVNEILWDVARNVISRLHFQDCVVYLQDEKSEYLTQVAAYGPKNPFGREIANPISIAVGKGIVGAAAEQKKHQLVADTAKDPRYIRDINDAGSELAVPILYEGKVIGVIDSEHRRKRFFNHTHVEVLQRIAGYCAHKIASAQAHEEMVERDKQLVKIQKEIAESKLTALQAQMNPHFIFNSLNSINWYIVKNRSEEASQYLAKFSKLVRLILDNSKKFTIPLKKELETLQLYLDLESMRFEEKFNYQIQTDSEVDLEEVAVPPLILQPFLENAIWHGLMHKKGKGNIVIQIFPENGHLKCIVQDDGIGRKAASEYQKSPGENHQSTGIKLTTDRIQLMHDHFLSKDTVRIIDLEDDQGIAAGTRVEVLLPYDINE